jgi:hypothetical protein
VPGCRPAGSVRVSGNHARNRESRCRRNRGRLRRAEARAWSGGQSCVIIWRNGRAKRIPPAYRRSGSRFAASGRKPLRDQSRGNDLSEQCRSQRNHQSEYLVPSEAVR